MLLLAGCTARHYRQSADKQVYGIIQAKSPRVPNMDAHFTLDQTNTVLPANLPVATNTPEFLGAGGGQERGRPILSLEAALGLALRSSRAYQFRKEQLYLSALDLTLARHNYAPLFSGSGNANYGGDTQQAVTVGIDELTGQPMAITSDNLVEQQRAAAGGSLEASWLLRDVGRISAALTTDFLRFVTGDPRTATSSELVATFSRPLLRNAGFKKELEALTQAERDVLYELRDFTQYRKDFSVKLAAAYYHVLGSRDAAHNHFLNWQSSRKNAERSSALAQEGRLPQSDLGRYRQQELQAEMAWIDAVSNYKQALDNFKLLLGLNVNAELVLDEHELETLQIRHPHLALEDAIPIALAARLDYLNAKDRLGDAERKTGLAANFLKPQVDFSASVVLDSNPNRNTGLQLPEPARYSWNAGLAVDPALDRLPERNAYRAALIARNRAARAVAQQEDDIKQQVRDGWRQLEQARRDYELSEVGVKINERRVEEQNLRAELGLANALDQVDAQRDLTESKNQRTQALVNHTVARLQFWENLGILYIKDNGQWEEVQNAQAH